MPVNQVRNLRCQGKFEYCCVTVSNRSNSLETFGSLGILIDFKAFLFLGNISTDLNLKFSLIYRLRKGE